VSGLSLLVLEQLIFNRNVHDAAAWLAGDSLPEGVLAELKNVGVPPNRIKREFYG
jgi:hypothetical protein